MKHLCGLVLFCVGAGMILQLLLPDNFFCWLAAMLLAAAGYLLFCSK